MIFKVSKRFSGGKQRKKTFRKKSRIISGLLTKIRLGPITPRLGLRGSALLGTWCRFDQSSKGGSAGKRENLGRTSGDSKMEIKEQGKERVGGCEELNQIYYMPVYK